MFCNLIVVELPKNRLTEFCKTIVPIRSGKIWHLESRRHYSRLRSLSLTSSRTGRDLSPKLYKASTDTSTCPAKRARWDRSRAQYHDAFHAFWMHFSGILCMRVFAIPSVTGVGRVRCISLTERSPSFGLSLVLLVLPASMRTLRVRMLRNFRIDPRYSSTPIQVGE